MDNSVRIKPSPQHWALYEQRPHEEVALTAQQKRGYLIKILTAAALIALLLPVIPSRHRHSHGPTTLAAYTQMLPMSIGLALLLAAVWLYEYLGKPAKNRRLGYRLVGRFAVRGKMQVWGKCWLKFAPDDTHRVGVPREFYDTVSQGDGVEVVYSATEDFIGARKIDLPPATG